jgi:hypothetical protein
MKFCRISRRHFLQGAGGFALTLPFLPSIGLKDAFAETPANGKFLIHFSTGHGGLDPLSWGPDVSSVQWADSEQQVVYPGTQMLGTDHRMRHRPLTQLLNGGRLSTVFDEQFTPLLPKMNLIDGLALMFGGSHHSGGYLGNFHGNMFRDFRTGKDANLNSDPIPTIDQILAQSPNFYPSNDPRTIPVLNLGGGESQSWKLSNGVVQPFTRSWSLGDIYDYVFGGPGGAQASPTRISTLDRVYEDYQRLMSPSSGAGSRLSREDASAVEQHMDSLSQIERRLSNIGQIASCNTMGVSGRRYGPTDPQSEQNAFHQQTRALYAQYWSTYVDIIVTAINCGLCRLFTIPIGVPTDYAGDYHQSCAHQYKSVEAQAVIRDAHQYVARHFILPMLQRLNDVQTGSGGTLLDNGLVIWQHESWYSTHEGKSIPTMMAGGANGYFRTGYLIDYRNLSNRALQRNAYNSQTRTFDPANEYSTLFPGLPMNQWLHTVLEAMGMGRDEYLARSGIPSTATMMGYGDNTVQPSYTVIDFDNTVGNVTQRVRHEAFPQRVIDGCNNPLPFIKI